MGSNLSIGGKSANIVRETKYQVKEIIKVISGENEEDAKMLDKAAENPLTKSERKRRLRNRKRDFKAKREERTRKTSHILEKWNASALQ